MKTLFFHSRLLGTKRRAWMAASLFALFVLASAPFALGISQWLRARHLFFLFLIGLFVVFFGYVVGYLLFRVPWRTRSAVLFLGLLFAFAALLMLLNHTAEERVHLLEFTLLGLLFLKAGQKTFGGNIPYLLALLISMGVGWLDEIWQGFLPGRVYDIQDVLSNAGGGVLGVSLAWIRSRYAHGVNR